MSVGKQTGKASISFTDPVYIQSTASVVGPKEGDGPLKEYFDMICEDSMFGEKTWESAESTMQKEAATLAIGKAGLTPHDIRMVFAGDLLAQTIASSFGIAEMGIPFYGLYGACSTMGESLSDPIKMYLGDIYTVSVNLAGLPGISLPCGQDKDGMPVGMQLLGQTFDEKSIIRAAYAFECTKTYKRPDALGTVEAERGLA